jgi:hypothetical protein
MREMWHTVKEINSEGIIELKQNYGNVYTSQYGSMVRAGDTPYDIDLNIKRCFYIQSFSPIVHNDYLAWTNHETPEDLAIMLIKMITVGVPTFSVDLIHLPVSHIKVIKKWMAFYKENISLWKLKRAPQNSNMDVWDINSSDVLFLSLIFSANELHLSAKEKIIIVNGTRNTEFYVKTEGKTEFTQKAYSYDHCLLKTKKIALANNSVINIPAGGYVTLAKI